MAARRSKVVSASFLDTIKESKMPDQLRAIRIKLLGESEYARGRDLVAVAKELVMLDGALPPDPDRTRADMEALRDRLALRIEHADEDVTPPRDVAALARVLREVLVILDRIPQHGERSNVVDITQRVQEKRATTEDRGGTGGVRDVRTGSDRSRRKRRVGS